MRARRPRPARRAFLLLFLLPALAGTHLARAQERVGGDPAPDGPTAGGRLVWVASDDLDLLGDLWADVPFRIGPRSALFVHLDTRAAVERTTGGLTFLVRDLDYRVESGWRGRMSWAGGRRVSLFLGRRGRERVDATGRAHLGYLGLAVESDGYRSFEDDPFCFDPSCGHRNGRIEWRVAGGPVLEERDVAGDFVVRGEARFWAGPHRSTWLSMLGGDLRVDGFFDGGTFRADVSAGPSLSLPVAGGRRFAVFVHYQSSRNPLGIETSSVLAGIDYAQGAAATRGGRGAPDIGGHLGAGGGGDSRTLAQLRLRFASPTFADDWYGLFDIEANLLGAADTDDLYYLYVLGLERFAGPLLAGAYYHHRSNHQLDAAGAEVSSRDVVEVGLETPDYHRVGPRPARRRLGSLDARLRAGAVLDDDFGADPRWSLRGGLRWTMPVGSRIRPFLSVEGGAGDVSAESYALGLAVPPAWDLTVEYRSDEQWFSADRSAVLLAARYGF